MDKKITDAQKKEEVTEERESIKFGYTASIVFLIFIGFVLYTSLTK